MGLLKMCLLFFFVYLFECWKFGAGGSSCGGSDMMVIEVDKNLHFLYFFSTSGMSGTYCY